MSIEPAGPFTRSLWEASATIRERIDSLDFLARLADGSLDPAVFAGYLVQDRWYLESYRKALALLASRADDADAATLWALGAAAIHEEEQGMQEQALADPRLAPLVREEPPSLTTRAYRDSLLALAATAPYPVAVAAVLPCYWVYAEVGARLLERAGELTGHPYGTWVETYGDPSFQETAAQAIAEAERCAASASEPVRAAMTEEFLDAVRFEELFWESAGACERWKR